MSKKESKTMVEPKTIYLKDYCPPAYAIDKVELDVELNEDATLVKSCLTMHRCGADGGQALVLDGEDLELVSIALNNKSLAAEQYTQTAETLTLHQLPEQFTLDITTRIYPQKNTQLSGLYRSKTMFCTQCEAHGFRRITYYLDRPDVLSRFTVRISADKTTYPILLANGNLIEQGEADQNRHWVVWEDPFLKPCYLLAMVAGDLACVSDHYTTCSGREVTLKLYVEHGQEDKTEHALASLKRAMRWDEKNYGREYDLDIFMIVAVSDFNMGAMENKGLNIFNSECVLANPKVSTDNDYISIEEVVAHEYFHNWTGNRITCRDWFQLSLKEGLTVFREQSFSADRYSSTVKRIHDTQLLRNDQFPEDAGPLAHPVQADAYVEINNFYTATVYEKGAEIIGMLRTLLGKEGFRRGMDEYFTSYDGQAVTIEDFIAAMERANGRDFQAFHAWYQQVGTPELTIALDRSSSGVTVNIKQSYRRFAGAGEKPPLPIPLSIALFDRQGTLLKEDMLEVNKWEQDYTFSDIPNDAVLSCLRHFSAPVKIKMEMSDEDLSLLVQHESDGFSRWEAMQRLASKHVLPLVAAHQAGKTLHLPELIEHTYAALLDNIEGDLSLQTELLCLPGIADLGGHMKAIDTEALYVARDYFCQFIAKRLKIHLLKHYHDYHKRSSTAMDEHAFAERRFKNMCLSYLMTLQDDEIYQLAYQQFMTAKTMTDKIAALAQLSDYDCAERKMALDAFYQQYHQEELLLNKWLRIQASSRLPNTLEVVKELLQHSAFQITNPNQARAVIGGFVHGSPLRFHTPDGSGYAFLVEQIQHLDTLNRQIAARLVTPLAQWRRYAEPCRSLMRQHLTYLHDQKLSKDVFEMVNKGLADMDEG